MSFSTWMTELHSHQQTHSVGSSIASSWAETDCESDSDCESTQYDFSDKKTCKRKLPMQRTAPIAIPQATHTAHARSSFEYMPSVEHEVEDYSSRESSGAMDINEEDLMLFGNLAYFRTQHGAKSGLDYCQRSSAPYERSTTLSSVEDDEIFDLEL